MSGHTPARSWMTGDRAAAIAVCLAACLPYLRTISDYFVQDDFGVVQLLAGKPWNTFPRWFTMPWMEDIWGYTPDEIRPFPALSYQLTALWGAGAPQGHHLLNIALHALNGVLVLKIARSAAYLSRTAAAIAAILFVVLPVDAETVAWITGRVDSMPAVFYLASFLAYVDWRQSAGAGNRYVWSLALFFLALFSKQNTITMPAAIIAWDFVVSGRPIRLTWAWLRPYVPFVLMTAGFLGVRYLVLGEVLRESQLNADRFAEVGGIFSRHLQRIVVGDLTGMPAAIAALSAVFALAALVALFRATPDARSRIIRSTLYFGPIWIGLGLAPAVAAGYESPRHVYLAAIGWTLAIGLAAEAMFEASRRDATRPAGLWRHAAIAASIAIAVVYAVKLHGAVSDWHRRAHVAKVAVAALEAQAAATPGALIVIGVPVGSWEWAMPFAARPPFARTDPTARVDIVTPRLLHCCRGRYWDEDTRRALDRWKREPGRPVVALYVLPSGEVRRLNGNEDPDLVQLVGFLPGIADSTNLDGAIVDLLRKLVAGRGRVVSPGS